MSADWFGRLGAPLVPAEEGALARLLAAHPMLAGATPALVAHWHEAAALLRASDWDSAWWDAEEEERECLWQAVADRLGEDEVFARVTRVRDALAAPVRVAAQAAAARAGFADGEMVSAAAGAALLAVQQAALAEMASDDAHVFVRKRALFTAGRWPLGLVRGRYHVF